MECFAPNSGVKQGCAVPPLLLNNIMKGFLQYGKRKQEERNKKKKEGRMHEMKEGMEE